MQKIISLFTRDFENNPRLVLPVYNPGTEWVQNGEGVATVKYDGTPVLVQDGKFFKRFDAKHGKTPPADFQPAQPAPDPVTGHWPGWVPVRAAEKADKYIMEALINTVRQGGDVTNGTYEAIGPKINGGKERVTKHCLTKHGAAISPDAPRTYDGLKAFFADMENEGLVWHHPDGRMVKIKRSDFGYQW